MAKPNRRTRLSGSDREPKDWRGETPRAARRSPRGRRSKVGKWLTLCATLVALSGLGVVLAKVVFRIYPVVPMLVFTVTDYHAPLPPNAWAQEDAGLLERAWGERSWLERFGLRDAEVRVKLTSETWSSGEDFLNAIADGIKNSKPGGPDKNVILMYISAHGLVDDKGQPVLLMAGPSPEKPAPAAVLPECVNVAELLGTIKESKAADTRVVLFLDAGRIESNWQLGVLYNSFADELSDVVTTANVPHLVLVNSTGAGQLGWCFPDLKCSAFGLAVCTGLEGRADTDGNRKVTFGELRAYLQTEVSEQVRKKYRVSQDPMFLSADPAETNPGADFGLAYVDMTIDPLPAPTQTVSSEDKKKLDELWEAHQRLYPWQERAPITVSTRRDHRLSFEAFQQGLIRLEELRQAGDAYAVAASNLQTQLETLSKELSEERPELATPVAPSLPLALRLSEQRQNTLRQAIRQHLPAAAKDAKELRGLTPDEVAWAAWEWMLEGSEEIRGELVDRALDLVRTRTDEAKAERNRLELVEMRTLRQFRADGFLPTAIRKQPQLVKAALRTRREAEITASAATEILALDGLRALADRGDQYRRVAQDLLFVGRGEDAAKWQDRAGKLYQQARKAESEISEVLAIRDQIWMETPLLLQWAVGCPQPDKLESLNACLDLLRQVATLDQEFLREAAKWRSGLNALPDGGADAIAGQIATMLDEARRLKGLLDRLQGKFDEDRQDARDRPEERSSLAQIRNLLRTPLVTGQAREGLGVSYAKAYGGDAVADADRRETAAAQDGGDSAAPTGSSAARLWLEHPELGHPAELLIHRQAPKQSTPDPQLSRSKQLAVAAAAVRQQLQQLVSRIASPDAAQTAAGEPHQIWLSRVQAACDASAVVTLLNLGSSAAPEGDLEDPLGQLQRHYRAEFWVWQARRMWDDFYGDDGAEGAVDGDQPYFARMAEVCLNEAEKCAKLPPIETIRQAELARSAASATWESGSWLGLKPEKIVVQPQDKDFRITLLPEAPGDMPGGWAAFSLSWELERSSQPATFGPPTTSGSSAVFGEVLGYDLEKPSSQPLPLVCQIADPSHLPDESKWTFRGYYRGHVAPRPFSVGVERPEQIVRIERTQDPPPSLQVFWDPKPGAVAICLDCSQSMEGSKIDNARRSLRAILEELESYPKFSVSLWFFGHRRFCKKVTDNVWDLTWSTNWENKTSEANDPTVTFENDVEHVWPGKRDWRFLLGETVIEPFGMTPLHTAMVRATREHLSTSDKPGARRLVVLSDGAHYVGHDIKGVKFNPPWTYDRSKDHDASDVANELERASRGAGQPVTAFLIADVKEKSEWKDLNDLRDAINARKETSCTIFPINLQDPLALRLELRRSLGLYSCSLRRDPSETVKITDVRLNRPFVFPPEEPLGRYAVKLGYGAADPRDDKLPTARFAVAGGEAITLDVKEDPEGKLKLVHRPYLRAGETDVRDWVANAGTAPQDEDFNPAKFLVAAYSPKRTDNVRGWRFPIAIKNADETRFSPRPAEIWAEITPLRREDSAIQPVAVGRPYVFYDPVWEPGRNVPVLLLETLPLDAKPWPPAGVNAVGVRLWFKQQRTEPLQKLVADIRSDREDDFRWRLDDPPVELAVTLRSYQESQGTRRGWEVVVLEHDLQHDDSPQGKLAAPTRVRVELSEPAAMVERSFYPGTRRVRHVFRYLDVSEETVSRYLLRVTPAEAIKKGAAEFDIRDKPLDIPQ